MHMCIIFITYSCATSAFMLLLFGLQEKRQDREVERLFVVLERVTEIRDTQVDRLKQSSNAFLPTLNTNLDAALNMCNRMIKSEEEHLAV